MRPRKIAFYGFFGAGNLGNECTLQVVVEYIRQRYANARLLCMCSVPADVRSRHQVQAVRAALSAPQWSWATLGQRSPAAAPEPTRGGRRIVPKVFRILFRRIPLELTDWLRGFLVLLRSDMLIVPGTGIVQDYLCGPAGYPYEIFKWSTLAALCRVRVIFLSIGVGPIYHPLSRWMILKSLRRADYRSYRDEESKQYAQMIGLATAQDPVYPDLVFGLSRDHLPALPARGGTRKLVGLGLKDYGTNATESGRAAYRGYLETMADFVSWLHDRGFAVRLLIGDLQFDLEPQREFCELLRRRKIAAAPPLLLAQVPLTVEQLLLQIAETDFVVSSRFHNLVLGMLLERPVLCLSDHAKLDSLFARLDMAEYRMPLKNLSAAALINGFERLEANATRLQTHIRSEAEAYRQAVEEQYTQVFSAEHDTD